MKISIEQFFRLQFPELYPFGMIAAENQEYLVDYKLLIFFANFCSEHPTCKQSSDILILINSIYKTQNIFVKNAIENEFLAVMVEKFGTTDMEKQLELIPSELQIVYKRILSEMKKESQDA
ncbi:MULTISPECIES: hypothetical protein [unclassified Kaistella]|uniref:DUF7674 family protein n=1 Tax=unclassified Kaistella TaxID=2762626 RepID=UPI002736BC96|nr:MULTISPECIES: hypothetical protein [unclassified Kaistella]MDP2455098.1 hypothetical protein [Kaistella sp. SH11-4b]MDP2458006.1 hypothetical protein [Kaistella sp. SH40-3]MDP2460850.1 hypothetical protein [Kaistella sp. SH19-2b]